jgi:hypothetical protein
MRSSQLILTSTESIGCCIGPTAWQQGATFESYTYDGVGNRTGQTLRIQTPAEY